VEKDMRDVENKGQMLEKNDSPGQDWAAAEQEKGRNEVGKLNKTSIHFSPIVLRTEHDTIDTYSSAIADMLLAVDEQKPNDPTDHTCAVYRRWIQLKGAHGQIIWARTVINGRAMRNTMCT
jgi:hypothetical protein